MQDKAEIFPVTSYNVESYMKRSWHLLDMMRYYVTIHYGNKVHADKFVVLWYKEYPKVKFFV